jgi:hypothetical protein
VRIVVPDRHRELISRLYHRALEGFGAPAGRSGLDRLVAAAAARRIDGLP